VDRINSNGIRGTEKPGKEKKKETDALAKKKKAQCRGLVIFPLSLFFYFSSRWQLFFSFLKPTAIFSFFPRR